MGEDIPQRIAERWYVNLLYIRNCVPDELRESHCALRRIFDKHYFHIGVIFSSNVSVLISTCLGAGLVIIVVCREFDEGGGKVSCGGRGALVRLEVDLAHPQHAVLE